jgi:hypothetical protein
MAAKRSRVGRFGSRRVEASLIPAVKSHTPECAKIEQFLRDRGADEKH